MLLRLRDALIARNGRPVRLGRLARELDTDPGTVVAMLDHARRRSLLRAVATDDDPPAGCAVTECAPTPRACRHCPLSGPKRST